MTTDVLEPAFFQREVLDVARDLLGSTLVSTVAGAEVRMRIVETEAYHEEERGAHCYGGRKTARTEVMFRAGGISYIYFLYGMHWNFNVVTGAEGSGQAVLVRAAVPLGDEETLALIRVRRGWGPGGRQPPARVLRDPSRWCDGPAKLCQAMALTGEHNARPLAPSQGLWLERGQAVADECVVRGPRVGIDYAGADAALPWRLRVNDR